MIENAHQEVRRELTIVKSGRGTKDYTVEDLAKPGLYPSRMKLAMAKLNQSLLEECLAAEVGEPEMKTLDCNLTDEQLKAIWVDEK